MHELSQPTPASPWPLVVGLAVGTLGLMGCRATPPEEAAAPGMSIGQRQVLMQGRHGRLVKRPGGFLAVAMQRNGLAAAQGFDEAWEPDGLTVQLTDATTVEQDHDAAGEGGSWVRAYEFTRSGERGVIVRRRGLDGSLLASSPKIVTTAEEIPVDLELMASEGLTYLATEYRQDPERWEATGSNTEQNMPPDRETARGVRLRVLDEQLELIRQADLPATIEGAAVPAQPWGMGSCLLRAEGSLWVFSAAAIGDEETFAEGESAGTRQIFALRYDDALEQIASFGPLTVPGQDSYWPTGCAYHRGHFFVSHTFRRPADGPVMGSPSMDDGHVGIAMLDRDLGLLQWLVVSETEQAEIGSGAGAQRSSILPDGDRLWLSYDQGGQVYTVELLLVL
jgi:hypothetical protein